MSDTNRKRIHPYPEEWPFALLMALQFFFAIGVFWILKPLKKTLFIKLYDHQLLDVWRFEFNAAQTELLAKNLNMGLALLAMVLFVILARKFRRHHLLNVIVVFLCCCIATLMVMPVESVGFVWSFYIFGDLFNMLMLASFFAFLNDSVSREQARRLMGTVVFGGVLGGAVGATATRELLSQLNLQQWLAISLGITLLIGLLAHVAARHIPVRSLPDDDEPTPQASPLPFRKLIQSRYIVSIALIVGSYEMVSSLVDFQFTSAVSHYLNGDAIGAYFSSVYMTVNVVAMTVQLLFTGLVLTRLGVTRALLVLPGALLLGSVAFLAVPVLFFGALLCIFDNGLNYSINQSARESLYVLIRSEARYRAKAYVDILIHRTSKALSVNLTLLLSTVLSFRWLAIVSICLIVVWISAARYAGKQFDNEESADPLWPPEKRKKRFLRKNRLFPIAPS